MENINKDHKIHHNIDSKNNLNLARKWRPQIFDEIVGQQIPIRMLKNSLYLKKYFPVYLFAGQRGCGKTTTARVFAAAINCHNLSTFQQTPTTQIPCLECDSCIAMQAMNHPDFIEIDAASHTGVDNVRQIIETSSYMPLSGKKKIYLIDEAHMLSKSAFNAFLKILEDPPETALFLLATTEQHKFPETVLSRCFKLTFGPIKKDHLKSHMQQLCLNEKIVIEDDALDVLIEETDGSARDALNLLEQVRFSHEHITITIVLNVLGKVSNTVPITIFSHIINQNPPALLEYLKEISFEQHAPQSLWNMIVELGRALIWIKYGIETLPNSFNKNFNNLVSLAAQCSIFRLYSIMQLIWEQEPLFLQTNNKHAFLELVLLQLCEQIPATDIQKMIHSTKPSIPNKIIQTAQSQPVINTLQPAPQQINSTPAPAQAEPEQKKPNTPWDIFIQKIVDHGNDPMLTSIFMQATYIKHDQTNGTITLQLKNNSKFLRDKIEESTTTWKPYIQELFTVFSQFTFALPPQEPIVQQKISTPLRPPEQKTPPPTHALMQSPQKDPQTANFVLKDREKWPITTLIIEHFPGILKKVKVFK
ncbi:MAG: DNA polymerase III subunit gamma/tau [bacterium]